MVPDSGAPLRIAFDHPDLGIGGAERLIVDAAKELQDRGHNITIFTSHHSKSHSFEETKG
jgi:alpha-1,3/alpha-1,6-mannosyltransferase